MDSVDSVDERVCVQCDEWDCRYDQWLKAQFYSDMDI